MDRMTIIGMGLIGTSLGLAFKKAGIKDLEIVGADRERRHASKAEGMGAVDHVTGNLASAVEDARIVIIATPVGAVKDVMEAIGSRLADGCLVTDTGDSKGVVMEWADRYLPSHVSFVGGHPMVDIDASGPEAADGSLFAGRPYCVIASPRARQDAVSTMNEMIKTIGAKPYFINVAEHDSFISAVSKLPLLLSVALVGCTSKSPSWDDIAKMASGRYGNATGLASNDPDSHRELFEGDNQQTIHWIDAFIQELYEIRQILAGEDEGKIAALEKTFNRAFEARNRWLVGEVTPAYQSSVNRVEIPTASENMRDIFFGRSETVRRLLRRGDELDKEAKKRKR